MLDLVELNTYKQHFKIAALERLEKVCHPSFQTTTDENAIIDMVQKDGSESIYVT